MLKNYIIRSHFESSKGVAIEGEVLPDNITLARIGGKRLEKCSVMEGTIIEDKKSEERCRTQLKLKFNDDIKHLITDPGGNHHVLIKGHWKNKLMEYYNTFIS
jgi:L-fucose isomerase-like protein